MKPAWSNARHDIGDKKHIGETVQNGGDGREHPPFFPEYINNDVHPFTYCDALGYQDKNGRKLYTFSGTDSPERLEENLKRLQPNWKYRTKEILYRVNTSGYRTYEWEDINWSNAIVILGCSCTYGIGLAEDERASNILEKMTGLQVVNLGYPGGSNHLMLNNLSTIINKFPTPKAIVMNWTGGDRFRYYFKHKYMEVGPWYAPNSDIFTNGTDEGVNLTDLWVNRYHNRYNEICEGYYIAQAAKAMCKNVTQYISGSHFDYMAYATRSDTHFSAKSEARDLLHPGEKENQEVAKFIYEQLQSGSR